MLTEVKGLVLRTTDIRESDRIITIFTEEMGVVSALARGARSLKSRYMSSTMQFCYSSFVLFEKDDRYWVREASLIESFFDIRRSIEGLALAGYIVEVLSDVTVAEADKELLRLSLNSLYAIASGKYPLPVVKAAFEMRSAAILGFMPDVLACRECGETNGDFFLDVMGGHLICHACHDKAGDLPPVDDDGHERHVVSILPEGAKVALGYLVHAPLEKIFSFRVSDGDMDFLSRAAETYLLHQLERSFRALEFYHEVAK